MKKELLARSENKCELCSAEEDLQIYVVAPEAGNHADECALICKNCQTQIEDPSQVNINHWRCLNDSMWSSVPAVQVVAWRMLNQLKNEGWPQDLLDMMYLEPETETWAKALIVEESERIIHKDANGVILKGGDSVVLIKDLNVKGANFIAKRGTPVRRIILVKDNPEHIEGRINGQHIVIIAAYVKKTK